MSTSSAKFLAWIDLETTGSLGPARTSIIEVGLALEDAATGQLLYTGSWVVKPIPYYDLERLWEEEEVDDVVKAMHSKNGLWDAVADPAQRKYRCQVEDEIIQVLKSFGKKFDFVFAGSGVAHFDRPYIAEQMPRLNKWFRYKTHDVGIIRSGITELAGFSDLWIPWGGPDEDPKSHRALDDALWHRKEWLHFKTQLKVLYNDWGGFAPDVNL